MFSDIFPMMAMHQNELDKIVEEIVRKIKVNGAENQDFSISIPYNLTSADIEYIEQEVERNLE